jgi:serine/threonine protein kinase
MPIRVEPHSEIIPGYTLIERLGGGGFGEVWKVLAPGGLHKAVKVVHGDMDTIGEESERADQELRALKRVITVRHPYILSLERFDIIEGRLLIVMELADRNLWDRFKECRSQGLPGIPREELLGYMEETAEALDLMNGEYQLQHLDIKPQNLFLVYNHIKVADFGLVKDLKDRVAATITGGVTPVYAAPETFDGWVSRYCDQYSLAIVYQELLTGKRPFSGNNVHQLVMQHVQEAPNLDALPPFDRAAIGKALAKIPEERFGTCLELVRTLRAHESGLPAGAPVAPVSGGTDAEPTTGASHQASTNTPTAGVAAPGYEAGPLTPNHSTPMRTQASGRPPVKAPSRYIRNLKSAQPAQHAVPAPKLEVSEQGELFPALVIGLGQAGLNTLKYLRQELRDRFENPDALPQIRLLHLDTDLEAQNEATGPTVGEPLTRGETLLARLNRASHYLKPRHGRPRVDTWLDPAMLYRIQRNEVTGGVRALGRLAFFGNYHSIALRLHADLTACTDPAALTAAATRTGLALRSTQPRVYVVTGLGGGTGSGMFIDLAYVVRDQLEKLGHAEAEVIGLFHLPAADPNQSATMALGNAYAALTELQHFSSPEETYAARFDDRVPPLTNAASPFNRCVFMSAAADLPDTADPARLAAEYLDLELTTPLGRTAEAARAAASANAAGVVCQSFGLYRYSWPRRGLLQRAARTYCRQLVQRWTAKADQSVKDKLAAWVQGQWDEHDLGAQSLIARFQEACARVLGQPPETVFAAVTGPLVAKEGALLELGHANLQNAVKQLERVVGNPAELSLQSEPAILDEALRQEAEVAVQTWQPLLDRFTFELMEQPEFRLAGAEEACRQAIRLIEQTLEQHETLCQELSEKAVKAYDRLQYLVAAFPEIAKGGRKAPAALAELAELLKVFPKWRYQSLVLRRLTFTYTSLRGHLSDQIREAGFFRLRFGELLTHLQRPGSREFSATPANGALLLPPACAGLDQAISHLLPEMTPEEWTALDGQMQDLVREQFRSFKFVCTNSAQILRSLGDAMLTRTETVVAGRLTGTGAVDAFFARYPDADAAREGLIQAFDEAVPGLVSAAVSPGEETVLLSVPVGGEHRLGPLTAGALPQACLVSHANPDDLIVYREDNRFTFTDLELLEAAGEEAYQQMLSVPHFTPHTRIDIAEWRLATARRVES